MNPLDRVLTITTFKDERALTKSTHLLSLRDMIPGIRDTNADGPTTEEAKAKLPWLKLATFGTNRNGRVSLRNNVNVVTIDGVEGDYDQHDITPADAIAMLDLYELAGLVYTSPSHGKGRHRWRVLCPLSKALPPESRRDLLARLNGALGGILAGESFTLSQAYYYGRVNNNPEHGVWTSEGRYLDQATDIQPIEPPRVERLRITLPLGAEPSEAGDVALAAACAVFDKPEVEGQRHPFLLAAINTVAPFILSGDLDRAEAEQAIRQAMSDSGREPNDGEFESAMEGALAKVKPYDPRSDGSEFGQGEVPEATPVEPERSTNGKPRIVIAPETMREQTLRAGRAIAEADVAIYQRGQHLVRIDTVKTRPGEPERLGVVPVTALNLQGWMTHLIDWERWDTKADRYLPTKCPKDVAEGFLDWRGQDWSLPVLVGLAHTPTMREDGSLLDKPGYDVATGIVFDPRGTVFPAIPDQPTRDDAERALADLLSLLTEFRFADDASRSVALSAILTAVIRTSLPTAPLHAVTAPIMASGKSFLTDLVGLIATGDIVAVLACGASDEELEKRLAHELITGAPCIVIDNATRAVNGPLLNQMISQTKVKPRRLGHTENIEVDCKAFVALTGNNLSIPEDMVRRTVLCTLDPKMERPEEREFRQNPLAAVRADRGRYVMAALTILRAFHEAGRPAQLTPLGSFNEWSATVRAALVWLGEADPVSTMQAVRASDPIRQRIESVMSQWDAELGDRRVTVHEIIETARNDGEFREALLEVAGERGAINGRRLGTWLGTMQKRIVGGRHFEQGTLRAGNRTWVLVGGRDVSTNGVVLPISRARGGEFLADAVGGGALLP